MEKIEPVGNTIREMREKLGISQEALARQLDVSWKTVSRYEGDSPPTSGALLRLVRFAEDKSLEDIAAKLRHAYVGEIGEIGIEKLANAYACFIPLYFLLTEINERAEALQSDEISDDVGKAFALLQTMRESIGHVLPFKDAGEVWDEEHGKLIMSRKVDDRFLPGRAASKSRVSKDVVDVEDSTKAFQTTRADVDDLFIKNPDSQSSSAAKKEKRSK